MLPIQLLNGLLYAITKNLVPITAVGNVSSTTAMGNVSPTNYKLVPYHVDQKEREFENQALFLFLILFLLFLKVIC